MGQKESKKFTPQPPTQAKPVSDRPKAKPSIPVPDRPKAKPTKRIESKPEPKPTKRIESKPVMFCGECGASKLPNAKFCPDCGFKFTADFEKVAIEENKKEIPNAFNSQGVPKFIDLKKKVLILSNKMQIPLPIFGLKSYSGRRVTNAMKAAYDAGYRSFDFCSDDHQLPAIADFLKTIDRSSVFLIYRFLGHGEEFAIDEFNKAIRTLCIDTIDLFMLGWPGEAGAVVEDAADTRLDTWRGLEYLYDQKMVRAIGVSNFYERHLVYLPHKCTHCEQLLDNCRIVPHVNEIEMHPQLLRHTLIKLCNERNIRLLAAKPFGGGVYFRASPGQIARKLAEENGITMAQVLLRWCLQHGSVPICSSTDPEHLTSNMLYTNISLSKANISTLDTQTADVHYEWDPATVI